VFLLEDKTQQTQAEDLKDKGMYDMQHRQHDACIYVCRYVCMIQYMKDGWKEGRKEYRING
jgi:hypothetical protein